METSVLDVIGWKAVVLCIEIDSTTIPKMIVRSNKTGDKMGNHAVIKLTSTTSETNKCNSEKENKAKARRD